MRELGVLVDGPVLWGRHVPSRSAGVYVIELPEPLRAAPIDVTAVGRWLERVPTLALDGSRPTPHELAAQLGRFWLPAEQIVYVGRSAKSIGSRLAAMYATPLGDNRPHGGGHWLRTLAVLDRLRVWWVETDAYEEYEDAVLSAVAERFDPGGGDGPPGAPPVLPYANLHGPTGPAKPHGLTGSLREATGTSAMTETARAQQTRGRATGRPRPAGGPSRAPRTRAAPPPPAPTLLSGAGLASLSEELEQLRGEVRPVVIQRVKAARELGDLRENSEYESARREQSFVEGRIQALEALIRSAVVVEADAGNGAVGVGSTVVVELDGEPVSWTIVGSSEADPAAGRISYAAPVGQALLGRRAGDEAVARLPGGELRLRVLEVS